MLTVGLISSARWPQRHNQSEWIFRRPTEKGINFHFLFIDIILHYFNLYLLMQDKGTINYLHWNKSQMKTWFYSSIIKLSKCPIWRIEANRMIKFALLMELKSAFTVSWMGITWLTESVVAWKNANNLIHPNHKKSLSNTVDCFPSLENVHRSDWIEVYLNNGTSTKAAFVYFWSNINVVRWRTWAE